MADVKPPDPRPEIEDLLDASRALGFGPTTVLAQALLLREALARLSASGDLPPAALPDLEAAPSPETQIALHDVLRRLVRERTRRQGGRARRWLGIGVLAAAIVAFFVVVWLRPFWMRADKATGERWFASSAAPGFQPSGRLPDTAHGYFFSTREEDAPSLIIDLGRPWTISGVRIDAGELARERAVPLVVEVSADGAKWAQVAERREVFGTWIAEFPSTTARLVRLRVARRSMLHLVSVEVI